MQIFVRQSAYKSVHPLRPTNSSNGKNRIHANVWVFILQGSDQRLNCARVTELSQPVGSSPAVIGIWVFQKEVDQRFYRALFVQLSQAVNRIESPRRIRILELGEQCGH
jgi:hypothetical protein